MGAGAFDPDVINGVEYVPLPQVEQAIQAAVAEKDARIKELEGRIQAILDMCQIADALEIEAIAVPEVRAVFEEATNE